MWRTVCTHPHADGTISQQDLHTLAERAGVSIGDLGPFAGVVAAVDALFQRRLEEAAGDLKAARSSAAAEAVLAAIDDGLHPDHVYSTAEASRFLGMKASSANKLPHALIPHEGGRWRGIWIMAYRGDVTREEAESYLAAKREAVLRATRSVRV